MVARLERVAPADRRLLDAAAVLAAPFSLEQMARLLEVEGISPTALVEQGWLRPAGARLDDHPRSRGRRHPLGARRAHPRRVAPPGRRLVRPSPAAHQRRAPGAGGRPGRRRRLSIGGARGPARAPPGPGRVGAAAGGRLPGRAGAGLRGGLPARRRPARAGGRRRIPRRVRPGGGAGRACPSSRCAPAWGWRRRCACSTASTRRWPPWSRPRPLTAADDHATRAPLEYLRGNLLFSTGDLPGCRSAHERALAHARQAESAADEVAALSGLGDASFLAGRADSAARAFRCLPRAGPHPRHPAHGGGQRPGCSALIDLYANQLDVGLASARVARSSWPTRIERPPPAEPGRRGSYACSTGSGATSRRARATPSAPRPPPGGWAPSGLQAMGIEAVARVLVDQGRRARGPRPGPPGPRPVRAQRRPAGERPLRAGDLALAEDDPQAARAAVARGEALLAGGCPCHNHFELREAAITLACRGGRLGRGPPPRRRAGAAPRRRAHRPG